MTSKLSETIPIIFHPGTYGTYLEYLLNTWTTLGQNADLNLEPFTDQGSSHNYQGNHLNDLRGWQAYIGQDQYKKFVRLHPKTLVTDQVANTISEVLKSVNTAIYIEPEDYNQLWVLNNIGTKVWQDWLDHELSSRMEHIYNNWPVEPGTKLSQIPKWIIREFLSLYLFAAYKDMLGNYQSVRNTGVLIIKLCNLIERPIKVLENLALHLNFAFKVDSEFVLNLHHDMMTKQKFYNRDIYCDNIVQAIICKDHTVNWQNLTIIDEAYIQHQLRLNNLELACDGLEEFPLTVSDILPFVIAKNAESAIIES